MEVLWTPICSILWVHSMWVNIQVSYDKKRRHICSANKQLIFNESHLDVATIIIECIFYKAIVPNMVELYVIYIAWVWVNLCCIGSNTKWHFDMSRELCKIELLRDGLSQECKHYSWFLQNKTMQNPQTAWHTHPHPDTHTHKHTQDSGA